MTFKKIDDEPYRGKYLIWIEKEDDNTISYYSTNSIFWKNFFTTEKKDADKPKLNTKLPDI